MSNNFDMIATVSINIASPVSSGANFGNLLILGPGPTGTPKIPRAIPDVGVYGSLEEAQDVGFVTDGANADPVGVAARVAFSQSPKPTEVYIAIQKKAAGASGARQTILDANEAIKSMVGQQADMTGCEIVFNEDTRRIYITLTGPGTDMANTGLAEALAALQEKDYTVSVGGTKVTDLAGMKTLPAFTEISEMEEGGEDVNVVVTVEHEGALDVSYGMTVRYPEAGVLRAAAENENSDEGTPIDNPTETLELATATAARAVGKSGWYLLCTAGVDSEEYEGIAAYIEATEKMFAYTELGFFGAGEGGSNKASVGSVYMRTLGIYGRQSTVQADADIPEANLYINVAMAAAWLFYQPGSETPAFKKLFSVYPSDLSTGEMKALQEAHLNYFVEVGGRNITMNGQVVGNEWADVIRFRDWLKDDMQTRLVNLFVTEPKVPYTDSGIAKVENQMKASLDRGQRVGGIAEDEYDEEENLIPGYTTTVPRSASLTASEKASRKLTGCSFMARLAGAIHQVAVTGTLTYENL